MTTQDHQNSRFQPLELESEDRAKMTYSIPDLVSRNRTKNQEFFQVLESTSPRNQIKTYRDANPEFYNALRVARVRVPTRTRTAGPDPLPSDTRRAKTMLAGLTKVKLPVSPYERRLPNTYW